MSKLFFLKGAFPNEYFTRTAEYISGVQDPDGSIPWFKGGYTDPWDHVESAMGLSICGKYREVSIPSRWKFTLLNKFKLPGKFGILSGIFIKNNVPVLL